MEMIGAEVFKVSDGEVLTIDVRDTGAQTLFGVNHKAFNSEGALTEGQPVKLTMTKDPGMEDSTEFPDAKFTTITLGFSFNSTKGGRYDWTMTGSQGGAPVSGFSIQAGSTAKAVTFFIHIV